MPYLGRIPLLIACRFRRALEWPEQQQVGGRVRPRLSLSDRAVTPGPTMTSYVAVTGPGTVWDDHHSAGPSPRVMVIEVANSNIHWMEPRDLTLEEACRGVGDGSGPGNLQPPCSLRRFLLPGWGRRNVRRIFRRERGLRSRRIAAGDAPRPVHRRREGWQAYKRFRSPPARINWTNCARLVVLILSCGCCCFVRAINFRRKRSRSSQARRAPALRGSRPTAAETASDVRSRSGPPSRAPPPGSLLQGHFCLILNHPPHAG